jgi:hypothetical protein
VEWKYSIFGKAWLCLSKTQGLVCTIYNAMGKVYASHLKGNSDRVHSIGSFMGWRQQVLLTFFHEWENDFSLCKLHSFCSCISSKLIVESRIQIVSRQCNFKMYAIEVYPASFRSQWIECHFILNFTFIKVPRFFLTLSINIYPYAFAITRLWKGNKCCNNYSLFGVLAVVLKN